MSHVSLSLQQAPPMSVPMRFFLTAPLFGIATAISLLIAGPDVLLSRWTPALLGITHLLTLGYITMIMIGAMLQLLPVLAATPVLQARRVSISIHMLVGTGTVFLGVGLTGQQPWLLQLALLLLATGLLMFITIILKTLKHSPSSHASIKTMRLAVLALLVTVVLGIYLASSHIWPGIDLLRRYTDLHLVWGLLGWVGLLIIGLAYQVVPMFQMTPEYPPILQRRLTPLLLLLLLIWSWGQIGLPLHTMISTITSYLFAIGFICFGMSTLYLQIRRRRRIPDVTLSFWRLGMSSLLLCILLWASTRFIDLAEYMPQYPLILGILLTIGFIISVITGMLYKIVPFLIWLHLQKNAHHREARRLIPNVKKIISYERARWQLLLHLLALVLFIAAAGWPQGKLIYAAAGCFGLSSMMLLINLLAGLRAYRQSLALMTKGHL